MTWVKYYFKTPDVSPANENLMTYFYMIVFSSTKKKIIEQCTFFQLLKKTKNNPVYVLQIRKNIKPTKPGGKQKKVMNPTFSHENDHSELGVAFGILLWISSQILEFWIYPFTFPNWNGCIRNFMWLNFFISEFCTMCCVVIIPYHFKWICTCLLLLLMISMPSCILLCHDSSGVVLHPYVHLSTLIKHAERQVSRDCTCDCYQELCGVLLEPEDHTWAPKNATPQKSWYNFGATPLKLHFWGILSICICTL